MKKTIVLFLLVLIESTATAQWKPLQGFSQGDVTSFLGAVFGPWAVSGGELFTRNNSSSWTRIPNAPRNIVDIVYTNNSSLGVSMIYAATNQNGVFLSTNYGQSWKSAGSGLPTVHLKRLGILPSFTGNIDKIFVATDGLGIYRTTDEGISWVEVNTGLAGEAKYVSDIAYNQTNSGLQQLLISTSDGIYSSTDAGDSWVQHINGITYNHIYGAFMNRIAANNQTIFTSSTNTSLKGKGLYRSTDDGANWIQVSSGLTDSVIGCIAFQGSTVFVGTLHGVFRSVDNGNTWMPAGKKFTSSNVHCLGISGILVYAGTDGGLLASTDGITWETAGVGLGAGNLTVGALLVKNSTILAGTGEPYVQTTFGGVGAFLSTNRGITWRQEDVGLPVDGTSGPFAQMGSTLFAGTLGYGAFRSSDNGASWSPSNQGTDGESMVNALGVINSTIFMCRENQNNYFTLYESQDSGLSWKNRWNAFFVSNRILCFTSDSLYWFAAGDRKVYRSSDSGRSWSDVLSGFNPIYLPTINAMIATKSGIYICTETNGIWRSSDHGDHWEPLLQGLTIHYGDSTKRDSFYMNIHAFVTSGDHLFEASLDGVFLWEEATQKWKDVGDGLMAQYGRYTFSLAVDGANLIAGLWGGGVWTRSIAEMTGEPASVKVIPKSSGIEVTNFPNPFSLQTVIQVNSEDRGFTTIEAYNILGTKVSTIFIGELEAGAHSFKWEAKGILPGIYSCVVRINSKVQTIPMILSQSGRE